MTDHVRLWGFIPSSPDQARALLFKGAPGELERSQLPAPEARYSRVVLEHLDRGGAVVGREEYLFEATN